MSESTVPDLRHTYRDKGRAAYLAEVQQLTVEKLREKPNTRTVVLMRGDTVQIRIQEA